MMNRKWLPLVSLTGALVLCLFLLQAFQTVAPAQILFFYIEGAESTETVRIWEDEAQVQYVFLPSYVDLEQVQIRLDTQTDVSLNGRTLTDGMKCDAYEPNEWYMLQYHAWGETKQNQFMFVQSTQMPALFLDTESGNMDYILRKKGNGEAGAARLYSADGALDYSGSVAKLNGRGNSTWTDYDKKSYSLTMNEDASLLGMPAAQSWALLANADDPSHLRNKLVYDFANEIGLENSPESDWVELYLNGEYAGLYLLSERNELHSNRIERDDESGYLVSMEVESRLKEQGYPYIMTECGVALRIREEGSVTEARIQELHDRWQVVEDTLIAPDAQSDHPAWMDVIDVDSWVKKYLIEEVFGNIDGCRISQFFYSPSIDGKVYAGPVWDFDHAIGSAGEWQCSHANTLHAVQKDVCEGVEQRWFSSLYQSEIFFEQVVDVYESVFVPQLMELLDEKLDEYSQAINASVRVDRIRWFEQTNDAQQSPHMRIQTYLEGKIAFLNSLWLEGKQYLVVKADPGDGNYYAYYYIEQGQQPLMIPDPEDFEWAKFAGWYYADTGEPFDRTRPVDEDLVITGSWEVPGTHKMDQLLRLLPIGIIALIGGLILIAEMKMHWRYR